MSAYKIRRWDAVTSDNIMKQPLIYIKPDDAFLSFVRANKFAVLCEISGTGMNYDHQPGSSVLIPGVVSRSSVVPNCRPNYYAATEYYVVRLLAPWIGYPNNSLGQVKFFGLEQGMPVQLPPKKDTNKEKKKMSPAPKNLVNDAAPEKGKSNNTAAIVGIVLGALALCALLIGLFMYISRKR